ncbi:hypothetical protein AAHH79_41475, partial [Burkholderia pseudomallei]
GDTGAPGETGHTREPDDPADTDAAGDERSEGTEANDGDCGTDGHVAAIDTGPPGMGAAARSRLSLAIACAVVARATA